VTTINVLVPGIIVFVLVLIGLGLTIREFRATK
jgi:hypothetical protein